MFNLILLMRFSVFSLMRFYVLFELRAVPILLIILYWGNQPERFSAGGYLFLYIRVVSFPFVVVVLFFMRFSHFSDIKRIKLRRVAAFLALSPFLVKMPVFGFHF